MNKVIKLFFFSYFERSLLRQLYNRLSELFSRHTVRAQVASPSALGCACVFSPPDMCRWFYRSAYIFRS